VMTYSFYNNIKKIKSLKKRNLTIKITIIGFLVGISFAGMQVLDSKIHYLTSEKAYLTSFLPEYELSNQARACANNEVTSYAICEAQIIQRYKDIFKLEYEFNSIKSISKKQNYNFLWFSYYLGLIVVLQYIFYFELRYYFDDYDFITLLSNDFYQLSNVVKSYSRYENNVKISKKAEIELIKLEKIIYEFQPKNQMLINAVNHFNSVFYRFQTQKLNLALDIGFEK
jgi:hypothetical protein